LSKLLLFFDNFEQIIIMSFISHYISDFMLTKRLFLIHWWRNFFYTWTQSKHGK